MARSGHTLVHGRDQEPTARIFWSRGGGAGAVPGGETHENARNKRREEALSELAARPAVAAAHNRLKGRSRTLE